MLEWPLKHIYSNSSSILTSRIFNVSQIPSFYWRARLRHQVLVHMLCIGCYSGWVHLNHQLNKTSFATIVNQQFELVGATRETTRVHFTPRSGFEFIYPCILEKSWKCSTRLQVCYSCSDCQFKTGKLSWSGLSFRMNDLIRQ